MKRFLTILATGFGAGKAPMAPGTFGTVVAIPLVWLFIQAGPLNYMLLSFVVTIGSIWVADWYCSENGVHDPKEVVIDEIAGFLVTMVWLPWTWQSVVAGFVLFRLLDAVKPFPISYLDKNVKGGIGVVVDDLAAGLIANAVLQVVYVNTNWLGVQLPS